MKEDSADGASYGCMMPFLLSILVVIVLSNFTKAVGYALFALVGIFPLYRMVRVIVAGSPIPLAEWFVTFLVGAAAATFTAMLIPEGDAAPIERTKLTVVVVALSFLSAFAGSAFAWFHIASFGERQPRLRWRWIFYSWAFTLLPWIALYAYLVATVK